MKKLFFICLLLLLSIERITAQNRHVDSLKHLVAIAKDDTNKVRLLYQLSRSYFLNSVDTAVIYAQRSLTLAEKLSDARGIARAQNGMCGALTTMGNYPLALEYGLNSHAGFEKIKDTVFMVTGQFIICFRDQGDYKNALKYVLTDLRLAELYFSNKNRMNLHSSKGILSQIWGRISSIYEKSNQLDSAIKYGQKTYEVRKNSSGILYVLGNAYYKKGQYDKAMQYFKLGIPFAINDNYQKDLIEIHNGIARVFKAKNNLDSAAFYCKIVLGNRFGKVFPAGLLAASTMLATIYESQNKTDSSFKYLKQTIALKDTLFNQGKTIAFQNLVFKEDQRQRDLEAAEVVYQNRLKIYGLIGGLAVLLLVAVLLWRNNQHKQKAYSLLQRQKKETDIQKAKVEQTLETLKTTQTQLIQREKLASLGELTAGIAHEIQNPLNFVNNFSELSVELIADLKEERGKAKRDEVIEEEILSDISQNLVKINSHGKRASNIIRGMLEHSKASTGTKEMTDINVLANEYVRLAQHGFQSKHSSVPQSNMKLETDFASNLPPIEVIPQDIGRVLVNLLNNAFYAVASTGAPAAWSPSAGSPAAGTPVAGTPAAGSPAAPLSHRAAPYQPIIEISTDRKDNQIIIKVKDNGSGIPENIKAKIFQPFFTTKPTGEGTGLGLSLAYDIVTKGHGGSLEVESVEGEGTEFVVKLPIKTI